MNVLITGAAGFVGSALSTYLADRGHFVTGLVRNLDQATEQAGVSYVAGDICDIVSFEHLLPCQDAIIHLAARAHIRGSDDKSAAEFRRINAEATASLARAAASANIRHFIFVSSIGVNGSAGAFDEQDIPNPVQPYAVSKFEAERALRELSEQTGLSVTVLRPPLIYGPRAPGNMKRLLWLVNKLPVLPLGGANAEKSFLSIFNFASFIDVCLRSVPVGYRTFLVADDRPIPVRDLAATLARGMNRNLALVTLPMTIVDYAARMPTTAGLITQLFRGLTVDNSLAKSSFHWEPPVDVVDGLLEMAKDYARRPW